VNVRVRLFAILRERAGSDWIELELADGATVADAIRTLRERPDLERTIAAMSLRMAVNRDYATPDTVLSPDDELALIPPVSGGAAGVHVRITPEAISGESLARIVSDPGAGAIAIFQGVTRDVERLEYEAYTEMAEARIAEIMLSCLTRHGLKACAAEHRVGDVPRGEASVIVAVSAAHRAEAFAGAQEAVERIKAEAPIWKREVTADGAVWVEGTAPPGSLTHLDSQRAAHMVDVGDKHVSARVAKARARVRMSPHTAAAIAAGDAPKGDVLGTARIAGIQAAKRTDELIPLAHPLVLTYIDVVAEVDVSGGAVELTSEVRTSGRTGVEMEAMTASAIAALTIYDMIKGLCLQEVALVEKRGGRSDWRRDSKGALAPDA